MQYINGKKELEMQRRSLYADLYQTCGSMTVRSLETVCRKIHSLEIKIRSFRGGKNGNKEL